MIKIPNIIHQIWIQGYDEIPIELKEYHDICKKINHNFTHIFWDDNSIQKFLLENFDQCCLDDYLEYSVSAQKADFARYHILYVYGGIYLDIDMLCKKNLSPFLNNNLFFTTYIFPDFFKRYLNGIIGAIPYHPLFKIIFTKMKKRLNIKYDIVASTGTKLFYDSVQDYKKKYINDITIVPLKYLHPCNIHDDIDCASRCTDCYIAHTNYSSWSPFLKSVKTLIKYIHIILIIIIIIIIIYLINNDT